MASQRPIRQAAHHAASQLLSLISVLSQFAGAANAFRLDWIPIAPDLKTWAAALSTLVSIGGFLLAWMTASTPENAATPAATHKLVKRAIAGMIIAFLFYWGLNKIYTADIAETWIDTLAQLGFLVLYSSIFGLLTYAVVLIAAREADNQ